MNLERGICMILTSQVKILIKIYILSPGMGL